MGEGEDVLWSGGPEPRKILGRADIFLLPFSIVWCGFIIFVCIKNQIGYGDIPFVLFGLYVTVGRIYYRRFRNSRTLYAVTSSRALILGPWSRKEISLRRTPVSVRKTNRGRRASVIFGDPAASRSWRLTSRQAQAYANTGLEFFAGKALPFAFYDVADPDALLEALRQAGAY